MKKVSLHGQLTFDEMKGSLDRLPKTNQWVQMGDSLPWTEYEKVYNKRLKNDTIGASNRPGRMVIAALIIKHKLGLSDEETILAIQKNPYMQYMRELCLVLIEIYVRTDHLGAEYVNPSTKFRETSWEEYPFPLCGTQTF